MIGDSADFPPWHPVLPARQYEQQQTPHYDLLAVVEACVQGPWPIMTHDRRPAAQQASHEPIEPGFTRE